MIDLVHELLAARLQAVPAVRHVDWYNQQDADGQDNKLPFPAPAVFMEYEPVQWNTMHRSIQEAELRFRVRILALQYSNRRENPSYGPHQLVNGVYLTLHGYNARLSDTAAYSGIPAALDHTLISSIQRIGSQYDHRQGNRQRFVDTYKCSVYDATKRLAKQSVTPDFQVNS